MGSYVPLSIAAFSAYLFYKPLDFAQYPGLGCQVVSSLPERIHKTALGLGCVGKTRLYLVTVGRKKGELWLELQCILRDDIVSIPLSQTNSHIS
jgi:hypothetical protein